MSDGINDLKRNTGAALDPERRLRAFCPHCGLNPSVDEDGCCDHCGSDAVGAGVDALAEILRTPVACKLLAELHCPCCRTELFVVQDTDGTISVVGQPGAVPKRGDAGDAHELVPVYVAHPLGEGQARDANRARASFWVAWLSERYFVAPVCTWITLAELWDESRRDMGLEIDRALVELVGTVVLCGDHVSPGMRLEAQWGERVIDLTEYHHELPTAIHSRSAASIDKLMSDAGIRRRHD